MRGLALPVLATLAMASWAQVAPSAREAGIYSCIDEKGRRLTSDRPILDCIDKDQRVLNKDGSLRKIHPAALTPDERTEREAAERKAAEDRATQADAVRRDRNLKSRFPNEGVHRKARESSLGAARMAMKTSAQRMLELETERKPLLEEAEFFKGKTMPARLKQQLEANETSVAAQREAIANQEAEMVRINKLYDVELDRLRRLWAGAQPGTLGPVSQAGTGAP